MTFVIAKIIFARESTKIIESYHGFMAGVLDTVIALYKICARSFMHYFCKDVSLAIIVP